MKAVLIIAVLLGTLWITPWLTFGLFALLLMVVVWATRVSRLYPDAQIQVGPPWPFVRLERKVDK